MGELETKEKMFMSCNLQFTINCKAAQAGAADLCIGMCTVSKQSISACHF